MIIGTVPVIKLVELELLNCCCFILNLGLTVTSTAAELNIIDGGTSATSTTIVDDDRT